MKLYYLQKFYNGFPTSITKVVGEEEYKQLTPADKLTVDQLTKRDYWKCYNIEEINEIKN